MKSKFLCRAFGLVFALGIFHVGSIKAAPTLSTLISNGDYEPCCDLSDIKEEIKKLKKRLKELRKAWCDDGGLQQQVQEAVGNMWNPQNGTFDPAGKKLTETQVKAIREMLKQDPNFSSLWNDMLNICSTIFTDIQRSLDRAKALYKQDPCKNKDAIKAALKEAADGLDKADKMMSDIKAKLDKVNSNLAAREHAVIQAFAGKSNGGMSNDEAAAMEEDPVTSCCPDFDFDLDLEEPVCTDPVIVE